MKTRSNSRHTGWEYLEDILAESRVRLQFYTICFLRLQRRVLRELHEGNLPAAHQGFAWLSDCLHGQLLPAIAARGQVLQYFSVSCERLDITDLVAEAGISLLRLRILEQHCRLQEDELKRWLRTNSR